MVLARYRALVIVRARYRKAGRKSVSISMCVQRSDADQYLVAHRDEVMAWAAQAVTKIKTKAPKRKA